MVIEPGQQLLHYRLIEKIGEGGMGVVWKALDTALDREVALKLLPESISADPERLARLEREARVAASLTHPNVAAVYGLHEDQGVRFIALELVPGEELAERIARGPLPLEEAVSVARCIADAITAAHDGGVIHRDLKPSNVKIAGGGGDRSIDLSPQVPSSVKVLDFGLAKALSDAPEGRDPLSSPSMSPTITSQPTMAGMLLGTAAYMSPEQARGLPVDRRADTWAFGCLLFEMLAGRRAFPGDTVTETLAAVLRGEPEWDALPADLPRGVREVLERCLDKDPRRRLRDVGDVRLMLDEAVAAPVVDESDTVTVRPAVRRRETLAWLLVAVLVVAAGAAWWAGRTEQAPPEGVTRFSIGLAEDNRLSLVDRPIVALSHDGRTLAFVAADPDSGRDMIFLRRLNRDSVWPVPGTDGGSNPFFSPDDQQLGFSTDRKLVKVTVGGGMATVLADAPNVRGAVWLDDGTIVYSPAFSAGLWTVSSAGGSPRLLAETDAEAGERTYRWVDALPDGRAILYTVGYQTNPNNYEDAVIAVRSLDGGQPGHIVVERASMGRFLGSNRLVFLRGGSLYVAEFDPDRLEIRGEPVPVVDGIGGDPSSGVGYFAISRNGDLTFVPGAVTQADSSLTIVDRQGQSERLPIEPRGFGHPRFSPDGMRIAFTEGGGSTSATGDIWIFSIEDDSLSRFTFTGEDGYPLWSRDGKEIAFTRTGKNAGLYVRRSDGGGQEKKLVSTEGYGLLAGSWSDDGTRMALTRIDVTTDVYVLDRDEKEPRLFEKDASSPTLSPDGRFLAYSSPASGNTSVFVRPIDGTGKWQVSEGPAGYPHWTADGNKLLYIDIGSRDRTLMEVSVLEAGDSFRTGPPRAVMPTQPNYVTTTAPLVNWDVDSKGDRFLFIELTRDAEASSRVELVLNWGSEIAAAAP